MEKPSTISGFFQYTSNKKIIGIENSDFNLSAHQAIREKANGFKPKKDVSYDLWFSLRMGYSASDEDFDALCEDVVGAFGGDFWRKELQHSNPVPIGWVMNSTEHTDIKDLSKRVKQSAHSFNVQQEKEGI